MDYKRDIENKGSIEERQVIPRDRRQGSEGGVN